METENSNLRSGSRSLPLVIDLNESPLPSPRETLSGSASELVPETKNGASSSEVTCGSCRKGASAEADMLLCWRCGRGFHVSCLGLTERPRRNEWKCFACLLRSEKKSGGGSRGGVGLLDINAFPPEEAGGSEVDASRNKLVEFVDLTDDSDQPEDRNGGKMLVSNDTFLGHSFNFPVPLSTNSYIRNGQTSHSVLQISGSDFNNPFPGLRLNVNNQTGPSSMIGAKLLASHGLSLKFNHSPSEVYLQALREYIRERKGVLGDGWHVDFHYCPKRCDTFALYCAPDGSRFESMSDVASHLGYPPDCNSSHNGLSMVESVQTSKHKMEEPTRSVWVDDFRLRPNIPRSHSDRSFSSELEIRNIQTSKFSCSSSSMDVDPMENCSFASQHFQDGFPIQFEDFFVISAGKVDPRPAYHNPCQIWPVGYRSSWHDKITGSLFVCDVSDGGDSGPIFKVQRCPCTRQSIPNGSTVILRRNFGSPDGKYKVNKDNFAISKLADDENTNVQMMLKECSPPRLDFLSVSKEKITAFDFQKTNSLKIESDNLGLGDCIGEFVMEGRSPSSVWEMAIQTLMRACCQAYKQAGVLKLCCKHDMSTANIKLKDTSDSLSKFSHISSPTNIPLIVQSDREFGTALEMLVKWLQQDRFGLDVEFVQEIIETLPGINACSKYKFLNTRNHSSTSLTVGSGLLMSKRKGASGKELVGVSQCYKRLKMHVGDTQVKNLCPLGKPISSKLPACLIGDVLQAWEFSLRFSETLGIDKSFSLQEFENELINPWSDGLNPLNGDNTASQNERINASPSTISSEGYAFARPDYLNCTRCTGAILTKTHSSLLKVLVGELLVKITTCVDPNIDAGEGKFLKRGRKKDIEILVTGKRTEHDTPPLNELTWPELARRYILALLSREGNLDFSEINSRVSGKMFHCLQGDGGILCGSPTGVAAIEADARMLGEATKRIFGSDKSKEDVILIDQTDCDELDDSEMAVINPSGLPPWAEVLEPVRRLPTNVGARIRNCVYEALSRNPPEWAKKKLAHSISKDVYKGNASGPTKKAVVAVLANVKREKPQPNGENTGNRKKLRTLSELVMKQCRIVLRCAVAADEERHFCNLSSRTHLNLNDSEDDVGLLGYPAMVSRALDFRTIDLRLAAGGYAGSHEAFHEDVREVWRNIRLAYENRPDLIKSATSLSRYFEILYQEEVLALVHKIEFTRSNPSLDEAKKERQNMLELVGKAPLPKAPWDEGLCKVCGIDKDDDTVLLCDKCDSEYHTYCLNPPLVRIPRGNWYCPACAYNKHTFEDESDLRSGDIVKELTKLATTMEAKEYWEFSAEERIFLVKFLCDEAINSAIIRDHLEHIAFACADLYQKLSFLTSDWKILKAREEILVANLATRMNVNGGRGAGVSSYSRLPILSQQQNNEWNKASTWSNFNGNGSLLSSSHVLPGHISPDAVRIHHLETLNHGYQHQADKEVLMNCSLELSSLRDEMSHLQDSIVTLESELQKVSVRKELLGSDSAGRLYWSFGILGSSPWILVNGSLKEQWNVPKLYVPRQSNSVSAYETWTSYQSDAEIEELIGWLTHNGARDRELKDSIKLWQRNKLKKPIHAENNVSHVNSSGSGTAAKPGSLVTRALLYLEKYVCPCLEPEDDDDVPKEEDQKAKVTHGGKLSRCVCLELLWASRNHCVSCHHTFTKSEELEGHGDGLCNSTVSSAPESSRANEDSPKQKPVEMIESSPEKCSDNLGDFQSSKSEMQENGSNLVENRKDPECPFDLEQIRTKFITQSSLKESVKDIGLIASNGVPTLVPNVSPYLSDPALMLVSPMENERNPGETSSENQLKNPRSTDSISKRVQNSGNEASPVERLKTKCYNESSRSSSLDRRNPVHGSIISECSLRPLVGRNSEISRLVKINLLDIDAALPEAALRPFRAQSGRRCAWRAFVKSASSIYEMIQATIILEDMIKTEYLRKYWWYWSSASAAAKVSTLSALALRVYTLDAAIIYEKPLSSVDAPEILEPGFTLDEEVPSSSSPTHITKPSSKQVPKTPSAKQWTNRDKCHGFVQSKSKVLS